MPEREDIDSHLLTVTGNNQGADQKTLAMPQPSFYSKISVTSMAIEPSNVAILAQLKCGLAEFELSSSPVPSVSSPRPPEKPFPTILTANNYRFFARIGPSLGGASPALKKVECYSVQKVTGDGRCLFRALVKGMALNKGISLSPREERDNADELRMAVKEEICDNTSKLEQYEEALIAITVEQSLKRYCQRIGRADFWGGESELLVLSKLCCQPITVYIPEHELKKGKTGSMVDGAMALFPLQNTELNFVKVREKENLEKL